MSTGYQDTPDSEDCSEEEPYSRGYIAYQIQKATGIICKNPFAEGTIEAVDWQGGFNTAEEEFNSQ